jgi:tRNA(adenine34) deaminase
MNEALKQAEIAFEEGEIPVGAIIVSKNKILAKAYNQTEKLNDVTAHAEMLAITAAENTLGAKYLNDCRLYVTLEPCPMCAGAIVHTRIRRVIFGCPDVKGGAAGGFWNLLQTENLNHRCEVSPGVLGDDCVSLLKQFFAEARRRKTDGLHHQKGIAPSTPLFDGP